MAEKNRSEKLKRLVAVQRHLERIAENELADTTRQRSEVTESMERVMDAIGSVDPVHMAFSIHYADRYGRLMIKDQQLESIQKLIQMKVQQERTKVALGLGRVRVLLARQFLHACQRLLQVAARQLEIIAAGFSVAAVEVRTAAEVIGPAAAIE